jgi:hypothetical protein
MHGAGQVTALDWLTVLLLIVTTLFVGAGINEIIRNRDGRK